MKEVNKEETVTPATTGTAVGAVLKDNGMGEVQIHENVISSLVRKAVTGVEGVARLSGSQLVDIIAETVGSRRMQDRAITVEVGDDGKIAINININLKFGFKIPEVTAAVQKAVISEIETTTGMNVKHVNVAVQELESPEETAELDAAATDILLPQQH